tara:strand:+ start:979 stop:1587 length:609 start_codon:yes stop_codon:yes gene_type:complete
MASGTAYPNEDIKGIMGISPLPGLINQHYNPLDMGKYEGNPNYEQDDDLMGFNPPSMQTADVRKYYYKGKEQEGSSTYIGALQKFLESQGKGDLFSFDNSGQVKLAPGNPGLVDRPGGEVPPPITAPSQPISIMPTLPDYTEKFSGYDTKIGGFDNQFKDILGRLDKLEQGIGSMANTNVPAPTPVQGGVPSVYTGNNARGY